MADVKPFPSTRDAALPHFSLPGDRELIWHCSSIAFEGTTFFFECPEETSNHFFRVPEWLALVSVIDFPLERRRANVIYRDFGAGCDIREITPVDLSPNYFELI
jgi:hypothetical protein